MSTIETTTARRVGVHIGATLMGAGALWYLVAETVAAIGFPGYSYVHNFISDLGIPEAGEFEGRIINSRLSDVMNAGFLGQGLLFVLGAVFVFWALPRGNKRGAFLALAIIHGIGISLVGLVHGSQENLQAGLVAFHFIGALMAIVGGNVATIVAGTTSLRGDLGNTASRISITLGTTGLVALVILAITQTSGTTFVFDYGVWERAAVYAILAWEIMFAGIIIAQRNYDTAQAPTP